MLFLIFFNNLYIIVYLFILIDILNINFFTNLNLYNILFYIIDINKNIYIIFLYLFIFLKKYFFNKYYLLIFFNYFFFFKSNFLLKIKLININLLNSYFLIHPYFIYLSFSMIILLNIKKFKKINLN